MLTTAFDALYPAGLQWYRRADFFTEITDKAIEIHCTFGERLPTGHSTMHLYPIDGAAARVPSNATAFAYRDGGGAGVSVGVDPDPANRGSARSAGEIRRAPSQDNPLCRRLADRRVRPPRSTGKQGTPLASATRRRRPPIHYAAPTRRP
jgi:hypothetical protein